MPRAIPVPIRHALFRRWQQGEAVSQLAEAFDLPPRTVRHWCQRFRQHGDARLQPSYDRCGPRQPRTDAALVQAAVQLRREHPTWGAGLIWVQLRQQDPTATLPAVRTLQRWLRQADLMPAPAGRRPRVRVRRAEGVHQVWQMDAAEQIPLKTDTRVSWLRIVDEYSGAVLQTEVFPPGDLE
jgi:transposase